MRLLKLLNSMNFRTDSHLNSFKKYATCRKSTDFRAHANLWFALHAKAYAKMGAQHTNAFLEFNAMYGEALRCGKTATPSTRFCERSERVDLLKFSNVTIGDLQNA